MRCPWRGAESAARRLPSHRSTNTAGAAPQGYDLDATRVHKHAEPHSNGLADASFPMVSMAELAAEDIPRAARDQPFAVRQRPGPNCHRAARAVAQKKLRNRLASELRRTSDDRAGRWKDPGDGLVIPGAVLCLAFVILGIGVVQFMGSQGGSEADAPGGDGDGRGAIV